MSKNEILRNQRWRLGIIRHAEEVTHNVAKTCRYFGISRTAFYRWYKKYEKDGEEGLKDRSHRPIHSPNSTKPEIIAKIIYLRQTYHFGPWKIQMYLKRYHDIDVSSSGVWRILKRLNMNCLPYNQRYKKHKERWKRYEKPEPGHRIQVDVKFLEKIPGTRKRYHQYTAIDDCTRLRVLRIYDRCNQNTSIRFIDYVLSRLPFRAEVIQTDNVLSLESSFFFGYTDPCHINSIHQTKTQVASTV